MTTALLILILFGSFSLICGIGCLIADYLQNRKVDNYIRQMEDWPEEEGELQFWADQQGQDDEWINAQLEE